MYFFNNTPTNPPPPAAFSRFLAGPSSHSSRSTHPARPPTQSWPPEKQSSSSWGHLRSPLSPASPRTKHKTSALNGYSATHRQPFWQFLASSSSLTNHAAHPARPPTQSWPPEKQSSSRWDHLCSPLSPASPRTKHKISALEWLQCNSPAAILAVSS